MATTATRVADRWVPYPRDDTRQDRTFQAVSEYQSFPSNFTASPQRPALTNLRLDSDTTSYSRRPQPPSRAAHSMDTVPTSAGGTDFGNGEFRSPDSSIYPQSAPAASTFTPSNDMEWVSSTASQPRTNGHTHSHSKSGTYFENGPFDTFSPTLPNDSLPSAHTHHPTSPTSAYPPYSPSGSYTSPTFVQPRPAPQRYPSTREPTSPTLSAATSSTAHSSNNSGTVIDPSLQESSNNGMWVANPPYSPGANTGKPVNAMSRQELEAEITRMRTRVSELEIGYHWQDLKILKLEAEIQHQSRQLAAGGNGGNATVVDNTGFISGGVAPDENFASSWRTRTDSRIKRFCALNRAGNALCAWHDSRRERRAFPPRQAPPGYLNCGCTNEEALFEESLARHGVGSYHPGEMVRMDPALRNPLLKLLEARFGYVDGDFERDPASGLWIEGEGHELWESVLPAGKPPVNASRRKNSADERK